MAPKYFLQSFNGTPHPLVRLSYCNSQTFSSCRSVLRQLHTVIYTCMYAADGILGSASVRLVYSRLGRQSCAVLNTSNCTECAVLAA